VHFVKAIRKPVPVRLLLGTVIRLLFICLVAGLFMAFFGIRPAYLLSDLTRALRHAWDILSAVIDWAATYVLLGAYVVVPVAAIILLLRAIRR
jgi:hypothetical protein